jgi:hypothetical protein
MTEVTISLEIELGWGFHDLDSDWRRRFSPDRKKETTALSWLLERAETHDIPISFDIVGHLFLEDCEGTHDGPHHKKWFDADPGGSVENDPLFYAPDLIEMIESSPMDHEICSHTFSHVDCSSVTSETLEWELHEAERVAGRKLTSLVPPRHRRPPMEELKRAGVETVRLPHPEQTDDPKTDSKLWNFLRHFLRSHPVSDPFVDSSVVVTPTSRHPSLTGPYLSDGTAPPHPAFCMIPRQARQWWHERYLRSALESAVTANQATHFWSHLYNLAHEAQRPSVEAFFKDLTTYRKQETIELSTMGELGRHSSQ